MTVSPCQRLGDAACLPKARFEIRLRLRTHVAAAGASRITPHMEGMHASQCVIARESAGRRMTRKSRIVNPPTRKEACAPNAADRRRTALPWQEVRWSMLRQPPGHTKNIVYGQRASVRVYLGVDRIINDTH